MVKQEPQIRNFEGFLFNITIDIKPKRPSWTDSRFFIINIMLNSILLKMRLLRPIFNFDLILLLKLSSSPLLS